MSAASANAELAAALSALPAGVAPAAVDRVWLFPARTAGEHESGLAVLSLFDGYGARRRVLTVRYRVGAGRARGPRADLWEWQGACPADRVERVIGGVGRRMGEEAAPAELVVVGGDAARWTHLLGQLAGAAG